MKTVNTIAAFVNKYLIYIMILLMIVSYFFRNPSYGFRLVQRFF